MTGAVEDWQSWRRLKNVLVEPLDMGPIGMKLQQRTTAFVSAAKSSMDAAKSSVDAALSSMEQRMDSVFENALSTGMNGLSKPSISNLINIDSLEETTDSLHSQFEQIEGGEGWAEVRQCHSEHDEFISIRASRRARGQSTHERIFLLGTIVLRNHSLEEEG
uniref:Uncharacterized protein n=1 Tax=Rhodosorus marinus TaxID=101924 RepID=A0A7S2ZIY6_9RHOD|mmetsp:Transcript_20651/g.83835  ORF Transcript_20651/g.83835 Transcript_20651/m.83835 type:complete len:162 (+) Transcript_20651:290-775(+)